jgi:hypothetical protein
MDHDFILLDRSGSMGEYGKPDGGPKWVESINSVNSYVKALAEKKVDTGVTLVVFDTDPLTGVLDFVVLRDRITPSTWRNVAPTEVLPRNGTPLNDATARIISLAEQGNYEKVAMIIVTDGGENASEEYAVRAGGTQKIKAMLDACRAKNWQVVFLGANFDNVAQAASYGTTGGQQVKTSMANMGATMSAMAGTRAMYAATGATMAFTDTQKKFVESDEAVDVDTLTNGHYMDKTTT